MNEETMKTIFTPIANNRLHTKFFLLIGLRSFNSTRKASAIELVCVINKLRSKYPCAKITYLEEKMQ